MNKIIQCLLLFSIATNAIATSVPFTNFQLAKNATMSASYSFGNHLQIICYEPSLQTIGSTTWPYQGNINSSPLPLLLKTKKDISGNFADPSGTITITNTTKNKIYVACEFGF